MKTARSLQVTLLACCVALLAAKAVDAYQTAQEAQRAVIERSQWSTKQDEQRRAKVCQRLPFQPGCKQVF